MDQYFHNISIALHETTYNNRPAFTLNSYSKKSEATERLLQITSILNLISGVERAPEDLLVIYFQCGHAHTSAIRRALIEACKLDPKNNFIPKPLDIFDKKSNAKIEMLSKGNGMYQANSNEDNPKLTRRLASLAAGYIKLAEMEAVTNNPNAVQFSCSKDHHKLISMLLKLAINARGVLRAQELAAARGVLSSPSQQR